MTDTLWGLLRHAATAALAVLITLGVTGELDGSNDRRLAKARAVAENNYDAWADADRALQAARAELAALRASPPAAAITAIEACNIGGWQVTPAEYECLVRHNYDFPYGLRNTVGFGIWINAKSYEAFVMEELSEMQQDFWRRQG